MIGMLEAARSVVSQAFIMVWTVACFFPLALTLLLPPRGRVSHWIVRNVWVGGILWFLRVRVIASGLDNFDKDRACVYTSNHQSLFDVMAILATNPANMRFIGKKSQFYIPFFGWYMALAGHIPFDLSNRRLFSAAKKAIRVHDRAAKKIRKGISIASFPEGTRSPDGRVRSFKKGLFMLAIRTGAPVVPVSITGSMDILPRDSLAMRPGTIRIHYGVPVEASRYSIKDRDRLSEEVRETIIRNKAELDRSGAAG
jgi:1-acyl-sn-glycerol-3-phosphate acyltransferase